MQDVKHAAGSLYIKRFIAFLIVLLLATNILSLRDNLPYFATQNFATNFRQIGKESHSLLDEEIEKLKLKIGISKIKLSGVARLFPNTKLRKNIIQLIIIGDLAGDLS